MDTSRQTDGSISRQHGEEAGAKFLVTHGRNVRPKPGGRGWVEIMDFEVMDATNGAMRAVRARAIAAAEPTGWHYNESGMQLLYMLGGAVTIELEDGSSVRLEKGDAAVIPAGLQHNEVDFSPDYDVLEVALPATMGAKGCDIPEAWRKATDR